MGAVLKSKLGIETELLLAAEAGNAISVTAGPDRLAADAGSRVRDRSGVLTA
jgi:hypothetical protein